MLSTIEMTEEEFQRILNDLVITYNQAVEILRDAGILRGRELANLTEDNGRALKAERSPKQKFLAQCLYPPAFNQDSRSFEESACRRREDNPGPQQDPGQSDPDCGLHQDHYPG